MFKGERKNIKTGVYVPENQWDTKRQCVKSTFSGFSELNETLFEIKRKYTAIRDAFIKRGVPYTVADIASGDRARTGMSDGLYDVLESMSFHCSFSSSLFITSVMVLIMILFGIRLFFPKKSLNKKRGTLCLAT